MANPSTPNGIYSNPAVNDPTDEDIWGNITNSNWNISDQNYTLRSLDLNFANFKLQTAQMIDTSETVFNVGAVSGAVVLDYENGHYQYATATGDITSLTINNLPASGTTGFLSFELTQDGTGGWTIDLTGGTYRTPGGSLSLSTDPNDVDILRFETRDAGTTIDTFINNKMAAIT
jgi:hypothetical protein